MPTMPSMIATAVKTATSGLANEKLNSDNTAKTVPKIRIERQPLRIPNPTKIQATKKITAYPIMVAVISEEYMYASMLLYGNLSCSGSLIDSSMLISSSLMPRLGSATTNSWEIRYDSPAATMAQNETLRTLGRWGSCVISGCSCGPP